MNIVLLKSTSNFTLIELNGNSVQDKVVNIEELSQTNASVIFIDKNEFDINVISGLLTNEAKYIPVIELESLNLTSSNIQEMSPEQLRTLANKVFSSWSLSNNLKLISDLYSTTNHLRNLWIKDRDGFFEEFWYLLKTNLNTSDLQIIFNDLKEPTQKQKEKGARPELYHATIKGQKKAQIFEAKEAEIALIKNYEKEFLPGLNITEFNLEKGELVFCSKIKLSPILVLAKLQNFSPLQSSIVEGLLKGLSLEE